MRGIYKHDTGVPLPGLLQHSPLLAACGEQTGLQDGYYTAQAEEFSHGWREYIMVSTSTILESPFRACSSTARASIWKEAWEDEAPEIASMPPWPWPCRSWFA